MLYLIFLSLYIGRFAYIIANHIASPATRKAPKYTSGWLSNQKAARHTSTLGMEKTCRLKPPRGESMVQIIADSTVMIPIPIATQSITMKEIGSENFSFGSLSM